MEFADWLESQFKVSDRYFLFLACWRRIDMWVAMSSRRGSKSKRLLDSSSLKAANSPSSSTTSSSKRFLETSIDGQSSPASSSARSKPQYYYTENPSSKENVTVTVRFRPLRYIYILLSFCLGSGNKVIFKCSFSALLLEVLKIH